MRVEGIGGYRKQSRFSDPGRFAELLSSLPVDPAELSAVVRNVIVHYRASGHVLPEQTRGDINLRWIESLLQVDQRRHDAPLTVPRTATERAQGCCRDHTLLCISALRAHGVPARSRVGFAGYFVDGWHHDHVIVEAWFDGRWQLFDPELADPAPDVPVPTDMTLGLAAGRGFVSAANAWLAYRDGRIDPAVPVHRGPRFLFNEVIIESAHRCGDELLLWDGWGRMGAPEEPVSEHDAAWLDSVARLLAAADEGAEPDVQLGERYRTDRGLHPGTTVIQASPLDNTMQAVNLAHHPVT